VAPGVYPEAVVIAGKYLYLSGAASDGVTIDGQGLGAPCLTIDGPSGGQTDHSARLYFLQGPESAGVRCASRRLHRP